MTSDRFPGLAPPEPVCQVCGGELERLETRPPDSICRVLGGQSPRLAPIAGEQWVLGPASICPKHGAWHEQAAKLRDQDGKKRERGKTK